MIKKFSTTGIMIAILAIILSSTQGIAGSSKTNIMDAPNVVAAANALNCTGTVTITTGESDPNYVYLSVPQTFWSVIYPMLIDFMKNNPPYCNYKKMPKQDDNSVGPHCSLAYPEDYETNPNSWQQLNGAQYGFTVTNLAQFVVNKGSETKFWYVLLINAPELVSSIKSFDPDNTEIQSPHISIAEYIEYY